jgi:hypothetical protein
MQISYPEQISRWKGGVTSRACVGNFVGPFLLENDNGSFAEKAITLASFLCKPKLFFHFKSYHPKGSLAGFDLTTHSCRSSMAGGDDATRPHRHG